MNLRTLLWNVGGCRIRNEDNDPKDVYSYCNEGLNHVLKTLRIFNSDILFIQESHISKDYNQTKKIANELNLPYFVTDVLSESHLDKGYKTGIAIISRFPLLNHQLILFTNPDWRIKGPHGEKWYSFDRGFIRAEVNINGKLVQLNSAHLFPFQRFKKSPLGRSVKTLREDMANKLKSSAEYYLLQGDFNYNGRSLKNLFPGFFDKKTHELKPKEPTRPSGKYFDRVVYRGLKLKDYKVYTGVLTDHYPLFCELEIL